MQTLKRSGPKPTKKKKKVSTVRATKPGHARAPAIGILGGDLCLPESEKISKNPSAKNLGFSSIEKLDQRSKHQSRSLRKSSKKKL